ncbi:AbiJ-related protein [Streptomyces flaveolus]|uniref:AbiJ-related protein n=1 Tax=Streptomyces flaveolus TaxID=67297 RepID=UPI0037FC05B7
MTSSDPAPAHPQPSITSVTRNDIFNYLREISSPWWGKLDEVTFLEDLYDLVQPTADNSWLSTVRADIQQHRINNYDLDDDWIFEDPRLELSDGPDEVLLAFLARTVHPEVAVGVEEATKQVEELNRLLAPDGWGLRPHDFLSGRPVYTPVRLPPTGPLVPLPLNDDDTSKLDLVLGQTYSLLDCAGEETACDLLRMAVLTLRRDGGFFRPLPGDGWTADTYEAVLTVERELQPTCTPEMKEVIWRTLEKLLSQLGRTDVQNLVVEGDTRPLPNISPDWRTEAAAPATPIVRGLRLLFSTTEFDVTRRDFADLEIRASQDSGGFHYLYDTRARRMITDFVLDDRPRVATLCNVTIIKKGASPGVPWRAPSVARTGREGGADQASQQAVTPAAAVETSGKQDGHARAAGDGQKYHDVPDCDRSDEPQNDGGGEEAQDHQRLRHAEHRRAAVRVVVLDSLVQGHNNPHACL